MSFTDELRDDPSHVGSRRNMTKGFLASNVHPPLGGGVVDRYIARGKVP